jgi:type III pantothenate kinase
MVLACDIGNTNVVIGVFDGSWKHVWRIETSKGEPAAHYSYILNQHMWEQEINPNDIDHIVMSSVVPELKEVFIELFGSLSQCPLFVLDRQMYDILPIDVTNPLEIGADIVANCMAVHAKYNGSILVIDFGTALTFTVLDDRGKIIGVNIAPGIKIAIENLMTRTSQLPVVDIRFPATPIGTNTVEAIQNGVLIGYTGLIKHMVSVIKTHMKMDLRVIATGGLSKILYSHISEIDELEPNLTLNGLVETAKICIEKGLS